MKQSINNSAYLSFLRRKNSANLPGTARETMRTCRTCGMKLCLFIHEAILNIIANLEPKLQIS